MTKLNELQIVELEEKLYNAMINSDIKQLDLLLSSDLIFTSHVGQIFGKEEELFAHKNGFVKIDSIIPSERKIKVLDKTAIVTVQMEIKGQYNKEPANGKFRFTRIWHSFTEEEVKVIAAHSCLIH